jgi:uncharacterized membrane protein (UPF0127 family)
VLVGSLHLANGARALRARKCEGFFERARGLLWRPRLASDEALLIAPCSAIHMFGMVYPIDVAFVDANGVVILVSSKVRPFGAVSCRAAAGAWEFVAGTCKNLGIEPGVRLSFTPND